MTNANKWKNARHKMDDDGQFARIVGADRVQMNCPHNMAYCGMNCALFSVHYTEPLTINGEEIPGGYHARLGCSDRTYELEAK